MFKVDLYTPHSVVAKGLEAESLLVPTEKGMINILPDHTHLISRVETGIMTVFPKDGEAYHFTLTKGVVKILGKDVTVLSDVAESSDQVDIERAKKALVNAEEMLTGAQALGDFELEKYRRKLDRAKKRLELAKFKK